MRFRQFLIFLINPTSRFKVTSSSKTRCGYYTDTKDQVVLWVRPDRQTDRQTESATHIELDLEIPRRGNTGEASTSLRLSVGDGLMGG